MQSHNHIRGLLTEHPQYQHLLFRRGYLVTSAGDVDLEAYPFFGNWLTVRLGTADGSTVAIHHHRDRAVHSITADDASLALIGHAYNPFTMQAHESQILESLLEAWRQNKPQFFDRVNELTGIHLIVVVTETGVLAVQDCAGMMSCYFGHIADELHLTSHPQLVADLRGLAQDPFVARLVASRMYNVGNRYLPGNSSPFTELTRLGANTYVERSENECRIKRFFPIQPLDPVTGQDGVEAVIQRSADLLHRNLELVTQKWERPAISLTGGTDSKTTLASASGLYNRFSYFSYHSKPSEVVDADAAHTICTALGLPHTIHAIPGTNDEVEDFEVLKAIIGHNTSYFVNLADHELRKMIYLEGIEDFDIEVKSWVSEIVRVMLDRRYGLAMPERLTPRHLSIFQTRYFGSPRLLRESDRRYADFVRETGFSPLPEGYEEGDIFYWELRFASWGTSVVSAFDLSHEVTIPYNNRLLVSALLSLPRHFRQNDSAHQAIMSTFNSDIQGLRIDIHNPYLSRRRQWLERFYYLYRNAPTHLHWPRFSTR